MSAGDRVKPSRGNVIRVCPDDGAECRSGFCLANLKCGGAADERDPPPVAAPKPAIAAERGVEPIIWIHGDRVAEFQHDDRKSGSQSRYYAVDLQSYPASGWVPLYTAPPDAAALTERCRAAAECIERLSREVAQLRKAVDAVSALIEQSGGVYGLHLNGDPAPWSELRGDGRFSEWLADFDAVTLPTAGEAST